MYITGTRLDPTDIKDDFKLPFYATSWGGVRNSQRFRDAEDKLREHPEVTKIVGHSLGASTAKELSKKYRKKHELYNLPGVTWEKDPHSHRQYLDPISFFDRGAQHEIPSQLYVHGYQTEAERHHD